MKKRKWIAWVLAAVIVLVGAAVIFMNGQKPTQNIYIVKVENLQKTIEGTGRLMPYKQATIYAPMSGKIKEICVQDGDQVKAGDILYKIDTTALNSQLAELEVRLDEYETTVMAQMDSAARQKAELAVQLAQNGSIEYKSIQDAIEGYLKQQKLNEAVAVAGTLEDSSAANAEAKVMKNKINQLKTTIENANVRTPIAGEISLGTIDKGSAVVEATPTVVINNTDSLKVKVTLHESEYGDVKIGQKVYVKGGGEGVVTYRKNILTKDSTGVMLGEFDVVLNKKPDGALLSKVNLTIVTQEASNCLVIPSLWISKDNDGLYVNVLENNRSVKKYITIGLDNGQYAEVLSGLMAGDKVISPLNDNTI